MRQLGRQTFLSVSPSGQSMSALTYSLWVCANFSIQKGEYKAEKREAGRDKKTKTGKMISKNPSNTGIEVECKSAKAVTSETEFGTLLL